MWLLFLPGMREWRVQLLVYTVWCVLFLKVHSSCTHMEPLGAPSKTWSTELLVYWLFWVLGSGRLGFLWWLLSVSAKRVSELLALCQPKLFEMEARLLRLHSVAKPIFSKESPVPILCHPINWSFILCRRIRLAMLLFTYCSSSETLCSCDKIGMVFRSALVEK